jgi:membrane protein DedA with SNARE-associated domain
MPLSKFFAYGSVVAVLQYGTLLFLGYFLGSSAGGNIAKILENVQYVIAFAAIAISAYYFFTLRMRRKFLKEDTEIEQEPAEGAPRI